MQPIRTHGAILIVLFLLRLVQLRTVPHPKPNVLPALGDTSRDDVWVRGAADHARDVVAVRAAAAVGAVASEEILSSDLLPLLSHLAGDKVPNVRFNAAKALHALHDNVSAAEAQSTVLPLLRALQEDADVDVKHFAQEALLVYDAAGAEGKDAGEHK